MQVEGILIVHQNNHPHILLLQIANTFFKLPGGKCKPGEDPVACLRRKLNSKLGPEMGNAPAWEVRGERAMLQRSSDKRREID